MPHFFGLPLNLCGKLFAVLFAKHAANQYFGEHIFTEKASQSFDCDALEDEKVFRNCAKELHRWGRRRITHAPTQ